MFQPCCLFHQRKRREQKTDNLFKYLVARTAEVCATMIYQSLFKLMYFHVTLDIVMGTGLNGWIDAKPTNQSQTITNIHLPKGGLTVLECQPSTNNPSPSDASVSWVRDKVPVGEGDPRHLRLDRWRLLVLNFSLEEPKKEARYKCIVSGLEHFNEDLVKMYTLFISEGEEEENDSNNTIRLSGVK